MISAAFKGASRVGGGIALGYSLLMSAIHAFQYPDATKMRLFLDGDWKLVILMMVGLFLLGIGYMDE